MRLFKAEMGAPQMATGIAYCGVPPVPGELTARFNGDPFLIGALVVVAGIHYLACRRAGRPVIAALTGWAIAAGALLSPLCALSVALFSARIGQHMILLLVAAPLLATALPRPSGRGLWPATAAFFAALWFWHMPAPYDATLASTPVYWAMHVSLFGTGVWLWRELLGSPRARTLQALAAGTISSVQMGMLGAVLALASHPMFTAHLFTSQAWGLTPLADQQLGGVLMWVPGIALFLGVSLRSFEQLWHTLERPAA